MMQTEPAVKSWRVWMTSVLEANGQQDSDLLLAGQVLDRELLDAVRTHNFNVARAAARARRARLKRRACEIAQREADKRHTCGARRLR